MLANFMAPSELALRLDAQVMLIKNMDEMLVNGSMGKVVRFVDPALYGTGVDDVPEIVGSVGGSGSGKKSGTASTGGATLWPVVEFLVPGGVRREVMILPEIWKVELPNGEVQVSRLQVIFFFTLCVFDV
jgi:ATP-dependent DNA helicase PIF1